MLSRLFILLATSLTCTLVHADASVPPGPTDAGVNAPAPAGNRLSDEDKNTIDGYVAQCRSANTRVNACCADTSGRSCQLLDSSARAAARSTATQVSSGATGGGLTDSANSMGHLGDSLMDAAKGIARACTAEQSRCSVVCNGYLARAKAMAGCQSSDLTFLNNALAACIYGGTVGGGKGPAPGKVSSGVPAPSSGLPGTPGYGGPTPGGSYGTGPVSGTAGGTVVVVPDAGGGATVIHDGTNGGRSTTYESPSGKPVVQINNDYSNHKPSSDAPDTDYNQQRPKDNSDTKFKEQAKDDDSDSNPKRDKQTSANDNPFSGLARAMARSQSAPAPNPDLDGSVPRSTYYGMPPVRLPAAANIAMTMPASAPVTLHNSVGFRTHATSERPTLGGQAAATNSVGGTAQPIIFYGPNGGQPVAGQSASQNNEAGQFKAGASSLSGGAPGMFAAGHQPFVKNHLDVGTSSTGGYKGYSSGSKSGQQQAGNLADYLPNGKLAAHTNGFSVGGDAGTSKNPQILSQGKDVWQNMSMRLQYFCKIGRLYDCK